MPRKTNQQLFLELKDEMAELRSQLPNGELLELKKCMNKISIQQTALNEDFSEMSRDLSMLKKKLLNPENGVVVRVNKNTSDVSELSEYSKKFLAECGNIKHDIKEIKKFKNGIHKAMWIVYTAIMSIIIKLLFFDGK